MNKEEAINILLQHAIDSCEKIKIRKQSISVCYAFSSLSI